MAARHLFGGVAMHVGCCGVIGRNASIITPDLTTNILPVATGASTSGFVFSASAEDSGNPAWKASCHPSGYAIEDKWDTYDEHPGLPAWWRVDFPTWQPICGYTMMCGQGICDLLTFKAQAMDGDGVTWIDIDSRTLSSGTPWAYRATMQIASPLVTRAFRLYATVTDWPHTGAAIQQIKIFGGTVV